MARDLGDPCRSRQAYRFRSSPFLASTDGAGGQRGITAFRVARAGAGSIAATSLNVAACRLDPPRVLDQSPEALEGRDHAASHAFRPFREAVVKKHDRGLVTHLEAELYVGSFVH